MLNRNKILSRIGAGFEKAWKYQLMRWNTAPQRRREQQAAYYANYHEIKAKEQNAIIMGLVVSLVSLFLLSKLHDLARSVAQAYSLYEKTLMGGFIGAIVALLFFGVYLVRKHKAKNATPHYSGKLWLQVTPEVHAHMTRAAELRGESIHDLVSRVFAPCERVKQEYE